MVEQVAGNLDALERSIDIFSKTRGQVLEQLQTPQVSHSGQKINNLLFGEKPITNSPSWQQILKDLIASVLQSPEQAPEVLGEVFVEFQKHWVEFVGLTVALIAAEAVVAVLAGLPEPTFLSKIVAIALQGFILAVYGVGIIVSADGAINELMNWWNSAYRANGDPQKIAEASRAFLRMIGNLLLLVINSKQFQGKLSPPMAAKLQAQPLKLPDAENNSALHLVFDPKTNSHVYKIQPSALTPATKPITKPIDLVPSIKPPVPGSNGGTGIEIIPSSNTPTPKIPNTTSGQGVSTQPGETIFAQPNTNPTISPIDSTPPGELSLSKPQVIQGTNSGVSTNVGTDIKDKPKIEINIPLPVHSQVGTDKHEESDGYIELHNHFNGILSPNKLIELSSGGNEGQFLTDLWNAESTFIPKDIVKKILEDNGILNTKTSELDLRNTNAVKISVIELLTANKKMPFDKAYNIRKYLFQSKITPEAQVKATLEELKEDGIKYIELQGGLPRGISYEHLKKMPEYEGIEIRFLELIPSERFASKNPIKDKDLIAKIERNALAKVGNNGSIGVDIAGAEADFTPEGMKRFKEIYKTLKLKGEAQKTSFVLRPHVGEGYHQRDYEGKLVENSNHRQIAQQNLEKVITALEEIAHNNGGKLSEHVIVRLGHATHATPEQLIRIQKLGIIVEANLTSNLATRTINTEDVDQVLLKFLYYNVRTILNTDGGGVMGTDIDEEYRVAERIIENFRNNRTILRIDNQTYKFQDLSPEKQDNFNIENLKNEAKKYYMNEALKII